MSLNGTRPGAGGAGDVESARRIVLADDDATTRELVRILLAEVGGLAVVGEAEDGVTAVDLVLEHEPEIALLDVQMPRLSGLDAAELISRVRPDTHVILHTGDPTDEMHERARRGGWTLLVKNDFDDSVAAVEEWLSRRQPLTARLADAAEVARLAVIEGYRLAATRLALESSAA